MSKQKKAVILIGFLPNPRMYKRIELEKGLFDEHAKLFEEVFTVHPILKQKKSF